MSQKKHSEKRQRTSAVLVRFTPEERRKVTRAAKEKALTDASFVRMKAVEAAS